MAIPLKGEISWVYLGLLARSRSTRRAGIIGLRQFRLAMPVSMWFLHKVDLSHLAEEEADDVPLYFSSGKFGVSSERGI